MYWIGQGIRRSVLADPSLSVSSETHHGLKVIGGTMAKFDELCAASTVAVVSHAVHTSAGGPVQRCQPFVLADRSNRARQYQKRLSQYWRRWPRAGSAFTDFDSKTGRVKRQVRVHLFVSACPRPSPGFLLLEFARHVFQPGSHAQEGTPDRSELDVP
jgi:hypothetical protein